MSHATGGSVRVPVQVPNSPQPSGWVGWVVFGAIMMIMAGSFQIIAGLVALFNDEYFAVTSSGLLVTLDFTTWGWVHLALGALVTAAGVALLAGQTWARIVGVTVAVIASVVNLAFLSAHPVWAVVTIALDVLVIYAIVVHGDELRD